MTAEDEPGRPKPAVLAHRALELTHEDPESACSLAGRALEEAYAAADWGTASLAERVLAVVARERNDLDASVEHLRRAVHLARRGGDEVREGEARMTLCGTFALRGMWSQSIRQGRLAAASLHGVELARLRVQLATALRLKGRHDEAFELYRLALPTLRRAGETIWLIRLHTNRGGAHFYCGQWSAAKADFEEAERLAMAAGQFAVGAHARGCLGIIAANEGDVPFALESFDRADELLAGREPDGGTLRDRCLILLGARLGQEARVCAERAATALQQEGQETHLAHVRLLQAEAALLERDPSTAKKAAEEAGRAFRQQHRSAWATLAEHVRLRAAWAAGDRSSALLGAARRTANGLTQAGFAITATDARLLAAQLALELDRPNVARQELGIVRRARSRGPVDLRARAWYAEALLRLQDGNRRGARSALRAGMELLDRYRAAMGATDLRVHAAGHGEELAALGVRMAFEDDDPVRLLTWSERCRAGSLRPRPARPPRDARLAADLAELRQVIAQAQDAAVGGRPTARLLSRQAALEDRVRDRARYATGLHAEALGSPPSVEELFDCLGGRPLLEIVEHDAVLHAVLLRQGRARLFRLAPRAAVLHELESLRFSLRRLAFARGSPASVQAAADAVSFGLKRLDSLLVEPVVAQLGDEPLVVVPTAGLHVVPWSALPSLGWRPVSVSPSAGVWCNAVKAPVPSDTEPRIVLVAGPGLPHAAREVASLARRHPGAVRLIGKDATWEAVSAALDGAWLAHVAAHGRFRSDNPLFSSIELVDGPATVYDLEALQRPPRTLVLSACDSGVADVRPGDELMGLAASLLALGTRTVVASIGPVPDDATRRLMLRLHAGLAGGQPPSSALALAQRRLAGGDPPDTAAAVGFVSLGSG